LFQKKVLPLQIHKIKKNLEMIHNYLDSDKKREIFEKYGKSNTDTGSAESQIALFSYRISHLTEHLKTNKKDFSTQRALIMLVGKRKKMLKYLKDRDIERYRAIIKELGLRR
jgi:small subunit ribosomal protein S15